VPASLSRVIRNQRLSAQVKLESATFRLIRQDEAETVCKFGEQEMTRTFRHLYNEADFSQYVAEAYTTAKYRAWIESPHNLVYGAYAKSASLTDSNSNEEAAEDLVAYVLAGPCGLPVPPAVHDPSTLQEAGEIKRIYAHPATFGSGISASLLVTAMEWLRSREGQSKRDIYLGVYSENDRAQKFYSKYNFKKVAEYDFIVGKQTDREFILRNRVSDS